jgi:alanine-glyoxylate transaminase / serine-glyoxylate transaminase / serine-pyruvate transaminase
VNAKPRGRQFFQNPGPTNIPDRILRAMDRPVLDFLSDEFMEIHRRCHEGVKRVLKTDNHLFCYTASGHGAWEAALANLFSPGDRLLLLESGYFSEQWGVMASRLGLETEALKADWRTGCDMAKLAARLAADTAHTIRAVLAVHNETATGVVHPIPQIRKVIDDASHPALLLVDTISSLGCFDYRMDAWGVDITVGGSQKGLMLPTGMSFTGVSNKALEVSAKAKLPRHYFNWQEMTGRQPQRFLGTTPVHMFFGLDESLKVLEEEGLDAVFHRHHRLAEATRRAVQAWSAGGGPQIFCADSARYSDSITAVLMPEGHDAEKLRKVAIDRFNLSLGGGLGSLGGKVFRIGHMGDLNEPMLLGALATVELAMTVCGVPYGKGGVEAAVAYLGDTR